MFDLTCGQSAFYLQPIFYIKVIWGIFSFASIIYMINLSSLLHDPFYPKIDPHPFHLVLTIIFFEFFSLIPVVLIHFPKFHKSTPLILSICSFFSSITMFLVISYSCVYGRQNRQYGKYVDSIAYVFQHQNSSEVQYFLKEINSSTPLIDSPDFYRTHRSYFDNRSSKPANVIIGIMIAWFLFHSISLFYTFKEATFVALHDNIIIDNGDEEDKFG